MQERNIKIAIFGSSSQVGSSIAFYLKNNYLLDPICIIRSPYSKPFFDICGIECIMLDINNKEELTKNLKDIDWVLDFTYPTGQTFEIPRKIEKNIECIISAMPKNSNYIYMSSIMAYGMPDGEKTVKNYTFPRATYGAIKRKAEKMTLKYGNKYGVNTFNFRLGQVHGFLQSVNLSFRKKLTINEKIFIDANPNDKTNTIFINSLAEAITLCINNTIKPGTYTLISNPQWTIEELYTYYKDYYNLKTELIFIPKSRNRISDIKTSIYKYIKTIRPVLETYILLYFPKISSKIKGKYRAFETKNQFKNQAVSYIDFHLLGTPSFPSIKITNSDVNETLKREQEIELSYNALLKRNTK